MRCFWPSKIGTDDEQFTCFLDDAEHTAYAYRHSSISLRHWILLLLQSAVALAIVRRTCYKNRRGPSARPKRWSLGIKRSGEENWRKHAQAQTYAIQCLYIQAVWQGVAQDGWCRFGRAAGCLRIKLARLTNGPIHHQIIQLFQISTGFHCMICGWVCHDVSAHLVP
jgi:hypothetical protein